LVAIGRLDAIMTEPVRFWSIDVPLGLTADVVTRLREVSVDFFGLSRPEESTVGHRIIRSEGDGIAAICIARWIDHSGFTIELQSSIEHDSGDRYVSEQALVHRLVADMLASSDETTRSSDRLSEQRGETGAPRFADATLDPRRHDFLLREYIATREEENSAQGVLATLTVTLVVQAGLFLLLSTNSDLRRAASYAQVLIWCAVPLIPLGIAGWIVVLAYQSIIRRTYLRSLEASLSELHGVRMRIDAPWGPLESIEVPSLSRAFASLTVGPGRSVLVMTVMIAGFVIFAALPTGLTIASLVAAFSAASGSTGLFAFVTLCSIAEGVLVVLGWYAAIQTGRGGHSRFAERALARTARTAVASRAA
jgi:hypothetical protein